MTKKSFIEVMNNTCITLIFKNKYLGKKNNKNLVKLY